MNWSSIGKILIAAGIILAVAGGLLMVFSKVSFIGNLPGDIHVRRENLSVNIPCGTSIIISIVLTVIINIILRFIIKR